MSAPAGLSFPPDPMGRRLSLPSRPQAEREPGSLKVKDNWVMLGPLPQALEAAPGALLGVGVDVP